jgi:hypothetical protein
MARKSIGRRIEKLATPAQRLPRPERETLLFMTINSLCEVAFYFS